MVPEVLQHVKKLDDENRKEPKDGDKLLLKIRYMVEFELYSSTDCTFPARSSGLFLGTPIPGNWPCSHFPSLIFLQHNRTRG